MGNRRRRFVEHALDALLVFVALASAGWAVLLSALCIGDSCGEDLRVTWWAWLAIGGALGGAILVLPTATRLLGRVLLGMSVVVAIVVTFVGP